MDSLQDQNRAHTLFIWLYIPASLATIILAARVYVRVLTKQIGLNDYLMVTSLVFFIVTIGLNTMLALSGGARHVLYLTIDQLVASLKSIWLSLFFAILAVAFAKCSVAFFILELFGRTSFWRRRILYAASFVTMASAFLNAGFVLGQCQPTSALWEVDIPGECWRFLIIIDFCYYTASTFTAMDFLLAFLPATFVWKLKMIRKKKLSLCLLLGTGVVAGIFAAIKTFEFEQFKRSSDSISTDFTWDLYVFWVWTTLETSTIIICGCIPTLKPLYDRIRHGKEIKPYVSSQKQGFYVHQGNGGLGAGETDEELLNIQSSSKVDRKSPLEN